MKRRLQLSILSLVLVFCSNTKSKAQITGITLNGVWDSVSTYCSLPSPGNVFFYGITTGMSQPNDSVSVYVNFGDGTDTSWKIPVQSSGGTFTIWGSANHNYSIAGVFGSMVIVSINGYADTAYGTPFTISNSCASLSGTVYADLNANCIKDVGEDGLYYKMVKLTNTSTNTVQWAFTDWSGDYSVNLPAGYTYTVLPQVNTISMAPTCPSTGTASVAIISGTYTQNFGYNCTNVWDATINGWAWNWRPGFVRYLHINAGTSNICNFVPATVTLTLPNHLSVANMTFPGTISGNTVTWNITSLGGYIGWWNTLGIYCDTSANIGDTLCVNLHIATTPTDADTTNNTVTICAPVNNSMDPNNKNAFPRGTGLNGKINNGTELTYLINFQNTGTDTAINITVADSIDSDFDFATLNVKKSSHPMQVFNTENNVVKFRFDNIMLPDSNHNEPASHGYVLYSIKPKNTIANGTIVKNKAYIYFDYNPSVITNSTLNTYSWPMAVQEVEHDGLKAMIFPNPANHILMVSVKDNVNFTVEVYDLTGRKMMNEYSSHATVEINTASLINGTYILRLISEDGKTLSTSANIHH